MMAAEHLAICWASAAVLIGSAIAAPSKPVSTPIEPTLSPALVTPRRVPIVLMSDGTRRAGAAREEVVEMLRAAARRWHPPFELDIRPAQPSSVPCVDDDALAPGVEAKLCLHRRAADGEFHLTLVRRSTGFSLATSSVSRPLGERQPTWVVEQLDLWSRAPEGEEMSLRVGPTPSDAVVVLESAGRPGQASVDLGPFHPLPLRLPADGGAHRVVILADGCAPLAQEVHFTPRTVRAECAQRKRRQVRIASTVHDTRVLVATEPDVWVDVGRAGGRDIVLAELGGSFEVLCIAPAHLPWRRRITALDESAGIVCSPPDPRRIVWLLTGVEQPTVELDARILPTRAMRRLDSAGSLHRFELTGVAPGPHQICLRAPGHRRTCRQFESGDEAHVTSIAVNPDPL